MNVELKYDYSHIMQLRSWIKLATNIVRGLMRVQSACVATDFSVINVIYFKTWRLGLSHNAKAYWSSSYPHGAERARASSRGQEERCGNISAQWRGKRRARANERTVGLYRSTLRRARVPFHNELAGKLLHCL